MKVEFANDTSSMVQFYVQDAPEIQPVFNDGTVISDNVADFGSGVIQPTLGIDGGNRILASPPLADVLPNATIAGENLIITEYSGIDAFGTGKVSWKTYSSGRAYGMRTYARISQIPCDYLDCEDDRKWDTASMGPALIIHALN